MAATVPAPGDRGHDPTGHGLDDLDARIVSAMTTTDPTTLAAPTPDRTADRHLRRIHALDAVVCAAVGAGLATAASPLADHLAGGPGTIRAVGLFLIAGGAGLALVASGVLAPTRTWTRITSGVDAAWVLASVVLCVVAGFSGLGIAITLAAAAVVAEFCWTKRRALR
jgi:hypothetical protein